MYDWLADALKNSSQIVTANSRLARALQEEYGRQQLAAGNTAWRTPTILAYPDWLATMLGRAEQQASLPTRLNTHQVRLLWERSLRREIDNPLLNTMMLARQANDAWTRLSQWQVSLAACESNAVGTDKRLFVRAARNYTALLASNGWIDHAGLPALVTDLIRGGLIPLPGRLVLVGFDRIVPEVAVLVDALGDAGCDAEIQVADDQRADCCLHRYDNRVAELRAAGAWVRRELEREAGQRIGVVVPGLEQSATSCARLLREGLVPGWQASVGGYRGAVNVSYGRKLADYPAIAIALTALRWLHEDLTTLELSQLLRTPLLGLAAIDGRSQLELYLRQIPDRRWSPAMLIATGRGKNLGLDCHDWLQRIEQLAEYKARAAGRLSPGEWAEFFDHVLAAMNWPGEESLDSIDFQLVNRWRELLNEFAKLELVIPSLSVNEACARLSGMTVETVFQPEADGAVVELLGPLEAAGLQFDKLWIAGFTAANWPAPARPLALVSRELQREMSMPDAEPQDTLDYSIRVLERLLKSTAQCVLSYPETDGDSEQVVSSLVTLIDASESAGPADPGWYATQLVSSGRVRAAASDPVPPVNTDEIVGGGAMTIQRQFSEPFAAFAHGRLGVRPLFPVVSGLAPNIRGNLLHDALRELYADRPSRDAISAWDDGEIADRCARAVAAAFRPFERNADEVLRRLLELERQRAHDLLQGVIGVDLSRPEFEVASVEKTVAAEISGITLQLRYDRVDSSPGGELTILDYKTGRPRQLLDRSGEPKEMQLVAYSCAMPEPVAAIGLVNVDTRGVNLDMAGPDYTPDLEWPAALQQWQEQVHMAAAEIAGGDVRISASLTAAQSRPLGLLSRYRELVRDQ